MTMTAVCGVCGLDLRPWLWRRGQVRWSWRRRLLRAEFSPPDSCMRAHRVNQRRREHTPSDAPPGHAEVPAPNSRAERGASPGAAAAALRVRKMVSEWPGSAFDEEEDAKAIEWLPSAIEGRVHTSKRS